MSLVSLFNILLIVLGFGLLIGIHELGHFLAAKWAGIRTNAFAIGMGPQVLSYRKGVGLCYKSTKSKVITKCGKDANEMTDKELTEHGISETEYSLRLLPIGGFVSMLGQEDGKPDEVSDDPRSFNRCPIGKRMIVVSAGVIMNLLLAGVFFLICFQIGVNFEAPIIGHVIPGSPAAKTLSEGATPTHLETGDTVVSIDGKEARTFQDIQIASAMAKPQTPVSLEVRRAGVPDVLKYTIMPGSVTQSGLLELGLYPASSMTIREGGDSAEALIILKEQHPEFDQLKTGMTMVAARAIVLENSNDKGGDFIDLKQWQDFKNIISLSRGKPIVTQWSDGIETQIVNIAVQPRLEILRPVGIPADAPQNFEYGFMGLVPLSKVSHVLDTSPNAGIFQQGDVITRVGLLEAPRMGQLRNFLAAQPDGDIAMTVLREGESTELVATLSGGKLGVLLANALDTPITAQPLEEILIDVDGKLVATPTAIAGQQILGGSSLLYVHGSKFTPKPDKKNYLKNWSQLRFQISVVVQNHANIGLPILVVENPTTRSEHVNVELHLRAGHRYEWFDWTTPLAQQYFEPLYVTRSSGGNPIKALQMGFDETINMVVMTYLTIDRLVRRTVGVDQLRGPVGIIHIGSKIADRGLSYLLFFLAIISVNLAVLNFLPLPIVDGGLFLYLIYEKLFKKPPSIAFQNAAAMLGLGLIATLFIVTFYNDIARLVG